MKRTTLILAFVAILVASCSTSESDNSTVQEITACECAKLVNTENVDADKSAKCKELRSDDAFDKEYKTCVGAQITGQNPNQVNIVDSDEQTIVLPADGMYSIDIGSSEVDWIATKISGANHKGIVPIKSGSVTITNGEITAASVVMDMENLSVTDLEGEEKVSLEDHLKSPDFFSVAEHGTASYKFTSGTTIDNKVGAMGDLTIKGVSAPSNSKILFSKNGENGITVAGTMMFDRTTYDIRYGSDKFFDNLGDKVIKDNVMLKIKLKGITAGV